MEYIVGDFVKISLEDKEQVVTVRGYDPTYEEYSLSNEYIYETRGYVHVAEDKITPIPLTHEILDKNRWEHQDDVYFKEYPHRKLVVIDEKAYIINESCSLFLCKVEFVHQLQHLLFGLGINYEMEL